MFLFQSLWRQSTTITRFINIFIGAEIDGVARPFTSFLYSFFYSFFSFFVLSSSLLCTSRWLAVGTQVRPGHFPTKGDLQKTPPADFPLIKAGRSKCEDKRPKVGTGVARQRKEDGREAGRKSEEGDEQKDVGSGESGCKWILVCEWS